MVEDILGMLAGGYAMEQILHAYVERESTSHTPTYSHPTTPRCRSRST